MSGKKNGVDTNMLERAQGIMNKYQGMTPAPNVFRFSNDADSKANRNVAFPVQLGSTDPDDEKYAIRNKLLTESGNPADSVIPGIGQVIADEKFFDYASRKKDQEVLYDFYRFMMSNANLTTPESCQWWFSKFPWMKELRLNEIDKRADLDKNLARIMVTGPESEDDFMLMYLIRNGTIKTPSQPVWKGGMEEQGVAKSFTEGFFSLFSRAPWTSLPYPPTLNSSGLDPVQIRVGGKDYSKIQWGSPFNYAAATADPNTGISNTGTWANFWNGSRP